MIPSSSRRSSEDVHQLRHLFALFGLVARGDRVLHAMGNMVAEEVVLDPAQGGPYRADLGYQVNAITLLIDHFGNASHLAFNAIELFADSRLDVISHEFYIPPWGICCKLGGDHGR
jgi:hypothetical protein